MKRIFSILWLFLTLVYSLAPFWAMVFGIGALIFLVILFSVPATPLFWPIAFVILFLISLIASNAQYGGRSHTTLVAPAPVTKK